MADQNKQVHTPHLARHWSMGYFIWLVFFSSFFMPLWCSLIKKGIVVCVFVELQVGL